MNRLLETKKAQITLFVVVAILIVASAAFVFYLRGKPSQLPSDLKPVETSFLECINSIAEEGARITSEQGGYIELPAIEEGSSFMPLQSQLNFFGVNIPYWFYLSGSNVYKKQVPTIEMMQTGISKYISDNIESCNFDNFIASGYSIKKETLEKVTVMIYDDMMAVDVLYPITIGLGDVKRRVAEHSLRVNSELGSLYQISKKIFDTEQEKLFLEDYTKDIIVLNAPTTGAVVSCAPRVWITDKVEEDVKNALQNNLLSLKIKGTYYRLANDENKYFVTDIGQSVDRQVRFFYSPLFPTKFEVAPSDEGLMKAMPVGTQTGLGILGFCYVPYHFVYSLTYPALVQIYGKDDSIFQFPVMVVIDRNVPRQATPTETPSQEVAELCKTKLEEVTVYTFDNYGKALEADVKYKCLSTICDVGSTKIENDEAVLTDNFPQCINGFVMASANGYATTKQELSTNEPSIVNLKLKKFYTLKVNSFKSSFSLGKDETLLLNLKSNEYSTSLVYPSQNEVKLSEGIYDVEAYLFSNGNIALKSENTTKCIKVPQSGIFGFFGLEREECYNINIPEQTLTQIVAGGGKTKLDVNEDELKKSSSIKISVPVFNKPTTIEGIQDNYNLIEVSSININLE